MRVSYFVIILSGVRDIFLLSCLQVFFLLNVGLEVFFESHKSPVQKREFSYRNYK